MRGICLRELYESDKREAGDLRHGATKFRNRIRDLIGLSTDKYGRPCLLETRAMSASEFTLPELSRAIMGDNADELFDRMVAARRMGGLQLLEAGNLAVQPSQFIDIAAWDATASGLLEAKLIEGFNTPDYICDKIAKTIPSKVNGGKMIAIGRIGDKAEVMAPGSPHPSAQMSERYLTLPTPQKIGLSVKVTKEAAFFDLTGNVLATAENVGKEIHLRKEKLFFDVLCGTTNPYIYGGTSYNTYLTSGNWVNTQSNPLTDWTNFNLALYLAAKMTDQETGQRISVDLDTIVCTPYLLPTVGYVQRATSIEPLTSGPGNSNFNVGQRTLAPNITDYQGKSLDKYKVFSSPILEQRLTDPDGLNITAANAKQYWWTLKSQEAFGWLENWPLTVQEAPTNDYVMADSDIVLATFGNLRGCFFVQEPRKVIRNTN